MYNLFLLKSNDVDTVFVLAQEQTKEVYDCWVPGSTQYKEYGFNWRIVPCSYVEEYTDKRVLDIIREFNSVDEFKKWLTETYFMELL